MPNLSRMIALSAMIAMGFFGIFLGKALTFIFIELPGIALPALAVWGMFWLIPAFILAALLHRACEGDDTSDDIPHLTACFAVAELAGMAVYYGYTYYDSLGIVTYGFFGTPAFLAPALWFFITKAECMQAAADAENSIVRHKPFRRS